MENTVNDLRAREKRPLFTKDMKEELTMSEKVLEFLQTGTDVRCAPPPGARARLRAGLTRRARPRARAACPCAHGALLRASRLRRRTSCLCAARRREARLGRERPAARRLALAAVHMIARACRHVGTGTRY